MHDVTVGEPEKRHPAGRGHPLVHGPDLTRPVFRQRRAGQHLQTGGGIHLPRRLPCALCSAIRTLVIHHDDPQDAGVILPQQGRYAGTNTLCLITRRHYGGDFRPASPWVAFAGWKTLICPPESAPPEEQHQPGRQNGPRGR